MKISGLLFLFNLIIYYTCAQKLPNVQEGGLRAPVNLKIDGKAGEWVNQLQAFNKATQVYYTVANDDDKLYLLVQMRDDDVAKKVIRGGITITISPSGSKNGKGNPAITFPKYDKMDLPNAPSFKYSLSSSATAAENNLHLDSLGKIRNRQMSSWVKTIGLSRLTGVTETEISLYNEEGISAAIRFESNLYCTYELAIPLKYLGLNILNPTKFVYQIKLNGAAVNGTNIRDLREGIFFAWDRANGETWTERINADQVFPTDFWGEYTLVKK
jgi:hypothetical protein